MTNQSVWDAHYTRSRAQQLYPDENVVRLLKKEFGVLTAKSCALDLGAGSGRHLSLLSDHFERVYACDFSEKSLRLYPRRKINATQVKIPELPYLDASFDFILCWGVLHYLSHEDATATVAEIRRALKANGSIFLTLRSDKDTHLKSQLSTGDLREGYARLFTKEEALSFFDGFSQVKYGFILRQILGEELVVAHHVLWAKR
ncbi:MAG TPA: class I SAM-dependent methyltransferase [Turneriella sp.]|nr:class I SAM-dependent methyltransferase [Turneriella sp.]